MSIALFCQQWPVEPWLEQLRANAPELEFECWPNIRSAENVEMALCWKHQPGSLLNLPNLKCISSMGAGVDHLLSDKQLPAGVPIVRIIDNNLTDSMFEYVLTAICWYQKNFDLFHQQQTHSKWQREISKRFAQTTVSVLGLGELGGNTACKLASLGFKVNGWSRTARQLAGVNCFHGQSQFIEAIRLADYIVCLLPLTDKTTDILNASVFNQCPSNCVLINVARGQHLVEQDLVDALNRNQLRAATLDVFREEPLPPSHPFWQHPKIRVTPHCSSVTDPASAVQQIIENYRRATQGKPLLNRVSAEAGY